LMAHCAMWKPAEHTGGTGSRGGTRDGGRYTWQCAGRTLLDTLAQRLAQVEPETRSETVTDVKTEAIVDFLADTLAEVKPDTLSGSPADVKAGTLDEMRH